MVFLVIHYKNFHNENENIGKEKTISMNGATIIFKEDFQFISTKKEIYLKTINNLTKN